MDYALVRYFIFIHKISLMNVAARFSHIDWHLNKSVSSKFCARLALTAICRGLAIVLAEDVPGIAQLQPPGK